MDLNSDKKQNKVIAPSDLVCDAVEATGDDRNRNFEIEEAKAGENLAWEEIRTEHIVQDEWIDFRRSAYRFPDGRVFEPFYSYSRRDYVVIVAADEE